jgi:hypothetical protein
MALYNRRIIAAALLATCFAVGCESDNKDDKPRNHDKTARRDRQREHDRLDTTSPDPVVARDRGRTGQSPGMDEIPADAQAVDTGAGARLNYEPTRDGVIYVYDTDADKVIYVGRIRDREQFRLDPDAGRAQINTRTVFRSDMNPRHRYRLYFEPARS